MPSQNNNFTIKKIDLGDFLDILSDLYAKGLDYIDIVANISEEGDAVGITFTKEYFASAEKREENYNKFIEEERPMNIKLSDEDLNQLL